MMAPRRLSGGFGERAKQRRHREKGKKATRDEPHLFSRFERCAAFVSDAFQDYRFQSRNKNSPKGTERKLSVADRRGNSFLSTGLRNLGASRYLGELCARELSCDLSVAPFQLSRSKDRHCCIAETRSIKLVRAGASIGFEEFARIGSNGRF